MWAALGLAGLAAGLQTLFGPTVVTLSLGPWTVAAALGLAGLLISVGGAQQSAHRKSSRAIGAEEFAAAGLGPVPRGQPAPALYLDLLKRTLINVVYYESSQALWVYGPDKLFRLSDGFELQSRVVGEDMPGNAMSMVGLKRLDNLEQCVRRVLDEDIPGDLVETGACKGGACIFMRALLKAFDDTRRRVFACDTFHPTEPPPPFLLKLLFGVLANLVASVPSRRWQRGVCKAVQKLDQNFPAIEEPSEGLVDLAISIMKSVLFLEHPPRVEKGLECVKSNFARFGLLDEQVHFLQGWFSDTLPKAPISSIAVLRLDGDTYESTMDALETCYPKLSPGGFCIIDDYHSFDDCKRAVDEYRARHAIDEEIVRIDGLSCFWRRRTNK